MKKIFALLICVILASSSAIAKNAKTVSKCASCAVEKLQADSAKIYAEQLKKDRATVANALQLSDEQSEKYLDITIKANKLLDEKFSQLDDANIKLRILKSDNTDSSAIKAQEQTIKQIKKDIDNIIANEDKELRKMLNHEQRVKLRMIKKLKRKDVKNSKHKKNYYKSNPKMREFAPHIKVD